MAVQSKLIPVDEFYAGDETPLVFSVVDKNGDPVDLDGGSVHWVLADVPGGTVLVDKPNNSGASITDAPNGKVTVTPDKADTVALKTEQYHHELEVTLNGKAETGAWGPFKLYSTSAN
ncbi:MAG: hypothetical protein QNJ62_06520 [Methyloceanibacter sp.]|nr:hypothetical protein [Methyloceanibacter sp.]